LTEEERQKVHDELKDKFEYIFDMDRLMPQKHIWVDRGIVVSCENAGHPSHRAFKRIRK